MNTAVQIQDVVFGYQKNVDILKSISFSVPEKEITVLLGKNGCGKSTLIDCIIGYNKPSSGSISVFGKNIKEMSRNELAQNISYIAQNTTTNFNYTVLEFILFGRNCRLKFGTKLKDIDYDIATKCAERCGISFLLDKDICDLSGGEQQLVYIARALAQESPIMVMDEPTSSLDVENQHLILSLLYDLCHKNGKTIILSVHNPNYALCLDSNVCLLKDGIIIGKGTAKDIICIEKLKDIYGSSLCLSSSLPYREISFSEINSR